MDLVDLKEFQAIGHLQEVNRLYFHPRGMALTLHEFDDGRDPFLSVQVTSDPEGFGFGLRDDERAAVLEAASKAVRVEAVARAYQEARVALFGTAIEGFPDAVLVEAGAPEEMLSGSTEGYAALRRRARDDESAPAVEPRGADA